MVGDCTNKIEYLDSFYIFYLLQYLLGLNIIIINTMYLLEG